MTDTQAAAGARVVLHQRPRTTVYLDRDGDHPVVVKVLNDPHPSVEELTRFSRDLVISQQLDVPGVRRGVRRDRVGGRHALVFEYAPGEPLAPHAVRGREDLRRFLETAIAAARVLDGVHAHRIVHKDVKPSNLICDPATGAVTLIDFGIASSLELLVSNAGRPEAIEGTLAYISPEQTGRTNRVVDWRSDLYSLGATFYELLTGQPPWLFDDAGELVHAHLARMPRRVDDANPAVPPAIADIVEHLLAKDAEDRYQSARGLGHDLARCLSSLDASGTVERFTLGARDASGFLRFPARLYGREDERAALIDAFARVRAGARELVLVAGDPGVGKSSLVHEVDREIAERGGTFVEGKFDQLQRSVPFSAVAQAFRQLIDRLLTEPDDAFARWRDTLVAALGSASAAITPLVPTLERVVGHTPALADATGDEVQNRFRSAVQAFVRALSPDDRPLVLFLDDLQWADVASLDVLRWILTDRDGGRVLVIGAYRDTETPSGHPLRDLLQALDDAHVTTSSLRLRDLGLDDVEALVAATLHSTDAETSPLARLVHEKTRGNAFFVRRFVQSLADEGRLRFDDDALQWRWSADQIAAVDVTDNVVHFVAGQLERLPAETQRAARTAACVGGRFDLATLSAASGVAPEELHRRLWPAVTAGLLVPVGRTASLAAGAAGADDAADWSYAFIHDRVRQAAYDAFDAGARAAAHRDIARSLVARTPPERRDERLFEIVNHFDVAASLVVDPAERRTAAELNLSAGRRAAASAAYEPARQYLASGLAFAGDDGWRSTYELVLGLHTEFAESSYLAGALEEADHAVDAIDRYARTPLDSFPARETRVMVAYARDRQDLVLHHGLATLRELGVRFPARPTRASIVAELVRTKVALRGKQIESLADLPSMTDPATLAAMRLIARIVPAAFRSGNTVFPLLVFRLVRLSVRYGNSPVSAFGYSTYAISLCGVLGDYDGGYRFALVGQRVAERFNAPVFRSSALFVFGNFVRHWKEPLAACLEPLAQSWRFGIESGARFEAVWATFYRLLWSFQGGRELAEVERAIMAMEGLLGEDVGAAAAGKLLRQTVANLSGATAASPARLAGPFYDEDAMHLLHAAATDQTHLCFYHAVKLQLAVWFGDVDEARRHAEAAEKRIEAVTSMPYVPIIRFYAALAAIDALRAAPGDAALERMAAKRSRMLAKWARRSPANYRHKHLLIEAERAGATGDAAKARETFDAALAAVKTSGLVHEEALVLERAGAFYRSLGQELIASALTSESIRAWRHWGAHAKVASIEHAFPALVGRDGATATTTHFMSTDGTSASVLDLGAMTKAASAISGVGERLLERLVALAVENGGATRGAMITANGAELTLAVVHAAWSHEVGGKEATSNATPLDERAPVCDAAIRLAARSGQPLVIDDATADARVRDHPWIRSSGARALLCAPIMLRERLQGILYLENDTPASFTPARVQVLTALGGEAAIALENARLLETQARLTEAHKRFVPHEFLRSLDRTDITQVQLGDAIEKTMSVLFADVRGFSTLVEGMTPAESIRFVNEYLGEMEPSITRHHGFVDEYQGDGILALFDTRADDALRGALDMVGTLSRMNERRRDAGRAPLAMGIGINTGRLVLGTIGGETHLKAGVVGDTVNLSARIESLTKTYGARILVGGELVSALVRPTDFCLRPLDTVRVVGRRTAVTLYECFDADPAPRREAKLERANDWRAALEAYRARDFAGARHAAVAYLARVPDDYGATRLAQRAERYLVEPPPIDWNGVEELDRK